MIFARSLQRVRTRIEGRIEEEEEEEEESTHSWSLKR